MYRLEITGKDLDDFKKAVNDINNVIQSGNVLIKEESTTPVEKPYLIKVAEETLKKEPIVTCDVAQPGADKTVEAIHTPTQSTPITNQEVDAEGLPWDGRIHSSAKNKTTKGVWKKRRNLDDDVYYRVRNELMGNASQTPVVEQPIAPQVPITQAPVVEQPIAPQVPVMPQTSGHTMETFSQNFPVILSSLLNEGKIDQAYIDGLKAHFQVQEIYMISDEQKGVLFEHLASQNLITKA